MTQPKPYTDTEPQPLEGSVGTTIRWVIDGEHDGAPTFATRVIEIVPGGHSPHHAHWFEHENFILEGEGSVRIGQETHAIKAGDVVFVPPDVKHQYVNTGEKTLRFI